MTATRAALEAALAATPDDDALHAAYADYLIEEGDPRGEYIRLRLLLEDRNRPAAELRKYEAESHAILVAHEAAWLGPLAEPAKPYDPHLWAVDEFTWNRGWLDYLSIYFMRPNPEVVAATLAQCHAAKLLREVELQSSYATLPRPTALRPLFNVLKTLPVRSLRLTQILGFGNPGVESLIASGLIDQLSDLSLRACEITSAGGDRLAAVPAVRRLRSLDLSENTIGGAGRDALAAAGFPDFGPQFPGADDIEDLPGDTEYV